VENFFGILSMISCIVRINQNIIEIDYYTDIKKVGEDVIHKVLKNSRSIGKIKEYNRLFKRSIVDVD